jgi:hypothetical protein
MPYMLLVAASANIMSKTEDMSSYLSDTARNELQLRTRIMARTTLCLSGTMRTKPGHWNRHSKLTGPIVIDSDDELPTYNAPSATYHE